MTKKQVGWYTLFCLACCLKQLKLGRFSLNKKKISILFSFNLLGSLTGKPPLRKDQMDELSQA